VLIEINLVPGSATASLGSRRLASLSLPALPHLNADLRVVGGVAAGVILLLALGFGYLQLETRKVELETQIQRELTDSARFSATLALLRSLQARQDTISRKIDIIRSVDSRRYVWSHLLDEISLAVPAHTWLAQINSSEVADSAAVGPVFTIQGNAGSTQALTRFMKNLEASVFIRDVTLITTEQEEHDGRPVQRFSLEARYRTPEAAFIETMPILLLD
jgi:Tfp pilus assembly protein PilN